MTRIHEEYVKKLEEIGRKLGFEIRKTTPIGQADCIWVKKIPYLDEIPIVAFEVICSEAQKELKGSFANMLAIRPSLAVFVTVKEEIMKHPRGNTDPEKWFNRIDRFIDKLTNLFSGILRIEKLSGREVEEIYRKLVLKKEDIDCPKLSERSPKEIASFLIRKFNEEKVKHIVKEFKNLGFTKESLTGNSENLFQFLVLVSYDRRPFSPYEIVWDKDNSDSVFSTLRKNGLINLNKIRRVSEEELHNSLDKLRVKGLRLSYLDLGKRIIAARTIKDIASKVEEIRYRLVSLKTGNDVLALYRMITNIHGIGQTIASKFIMYVVRCIGVGNILPHEYGTLASSLKNEWRNSKWVKRLKKHDILEEVEKELRKDPFAFDYFWDLDRNYCSKGRCEECEL